MRADEPVYPSAEGRTRLRLAGATLVAAMVLGACTGENLFTGLAGGIELGPQVEITTPTPGFTMAVGDSLKVDAVLSGSNGLTEVSFTGLFQTGGVAFVTEILQLNNSTDTTVSNFLQQPDGAGGGTASVIVEATDVLGDRGADTVSVTIN